LNYQFGEQHFKRIRKTMFAEMKENRGGVKAFHPHNSIQYAQSLRGPKKHFISEWDSIWPEEEPEPIVEPGKKKPKRAVKEEEWKMYQHHKYEFAPIGSKKNKLLDNIVVTHEEALTKAANGEDEDVPTTQAISLSYFSRPNT